MAILEKVQRNSNIELLRIVLIIMVIFLHFNNGEMGGAFNYIDEKPASKFFLYFLESLSICAVNCFMIISGYFLAYNKKVKIARIVDLFLIVVFYQFLNFFVSILLFDKSFSLKSLLFCFIPANFFFILYSVTYIFSPFIVKIFDSLSEKKQDLFLGLSILIFIVYPTFLNLVENLIGKSMVSISPISTNFGTGEGYTIVQFLCDFSIGIYLKRRKPKIKNSFLVVLYILSSFIMTFGIEKFPSLYNYCSLFTVINAVCLFLFFNKLNIKNKAVNFIAKSVFAIFCLHVSFFTLETWRRFFITENHLTGGTINVIFWSFISVFSMFLFSLSIDVLVRFTIGKIKNKLLLKVNFEFEV